MYGLYGGSVDPLDDGQGITHYGEWADDVVQHFHYFDAFYKQLLIQVI
eukprot:SAG11_NODE_9358_length_919_cov_1.091463_2_plen_47_part_01